MQPLSVFVSSTCYDLKSLREHLRDSITTLGHEAVLSEYPSFPVVPDISTVENCRKVVRDRADVLVLIVGGKRGSLDPATGKSVVNSEYREARTKGIDCLVFVERTVWDLLPTYNNNPDADFSASVDFLDVFRFVQEIKKETCWIFPFSKTEEILAVLRTQFSIRFKDLLDRYRTNRLVVPPDFANEPDSIVRLAVDQDRFWELRLTAALLAERVTRLEAKFSDLDCGYIVNQTRYLRGSDTINFIQDQMADFSNIVLGVERVLNNQLTPAFGPPGTPGNASQIKRACDNLFQLFISLYDWELKVKFVRPHEALRSLFTKMTGWSHEYLANLRRMVDETESLASNVEASGDYTITLDFTPPKGLAELAEEFERMSNDPVVQMALSEV